MSGVTYGPYRPFHRSRARRLVGRGWERLVTVVDGAENVVIYAQAGKRLSETMKVCVGVVTGSELVVVSATLRPGELMPVIEKHLQEAKHRL